MDIIVTTPKSQMATAALEAKNCQESGGGQYFRKLSTAPKNFGPGDKIWYVENGYVRGYCLAKKVVKPSPKIVLVCDTTGEEWTDGVFIFMEANTWNWVQPIKMKGFQGYRYFNPVKYSVAGNWMDPRPC